MTKKPAVLAALVLAGATAALLAMLPFMRSPAPRDEPAAVQQPAPEPEKPVLPPASGSSLALVRTGLPPEPGADGVHCVSRHEGAFVEPATLRALLACQARLRGARPADEAFNDGQRAEVREYLSRHPERASTEEPAPARRARP